MIRAALSIALAVAAGAASAQSAQEAKAGVSFTRHSDITLSPGARKTLRGIRENHLFTVGFNKSPAFHTAIFYDPSTGRFFHSGGKDPLETSVRWARKSCLSYADDPANCLLFATITPRKN